MVRIPVVVLPTRLASTIHRIWISQGHYRQSGFIGDQWACMSFPIACFIAFPLRFGNLAKALDSQTSGANPRAAWFALGVIYVCNSKNFVLWA
jgi:hypothetical protein